MNPLVLSASSVWSSLLRRPPHSGCRAIRRIGDSRQSIAARRLSGQGFQAMHDGQWEIAETLFTDALDVSKSDDRAHWGLAEAYWKRGERELAVEQMEQAVRLSADDPAFVQRLGRMYLEIGRLAEADTHSQSALRIRARFAGGMGIAWRLSEGGRQAQRSVGGLSPRVGPATRFPGSPTPMPPKSTSHRERYDRLLATLDRLQDGTGVDDAPARVDILKGIAMRQLGRTEEAEQCFVRASSKDPTNAKPHLELASLAMERGDVTLAQQSLAVALKLNPTSVPTDAWMNDLHAVNGPGGPVMNTEQRLASEQDASDSVTTASLAVSIMTITTIGWIECMVGLSFAAPHLLSRTLSGSSGVDS